MSMQTLFRYSASMFISNNQTSLDEPLAQLNQDTSELNQTRYRKNIDQSMSQTRMMLERAQDSQ